MREDGTHERLFASLDVDGIGYLTEESLARALQDAGHPLRDVPNAAKRLFAAMDTDKDGIVRPAELDAYMNEAEKQIRDGFRRLDHDNDGRIGMAELKRYMGLDSDTGLSRFVGWAFRSSAKHPRIPNKLSQEQHDFITFDQWRNLLLLTPREGGSRLHAAYTYYLFNADVDLSSEGDMTLINEFINGFGYFAAGGISGVISRTCTAPFDRLKVFLIARTDLSSTLLNSKQDVLAKNPNANVEKIQSPLIKAIKTLYRQGGLKSFYVGNGLNAIKVFPESSIKFGSFEFVKTLLANLEGHTQSSELSKPATYVAGGLAGMVSQFSVYPIDTLKFRVQCAPLESRKQGAALMLQTAKEMYREGGLRVFYRGVTVGLLGIFPYAALDLGTFSALKKWYINKKAVELHVHKDEVELNSLVVLPMGAISGTVGATVVYPINLLRTRLQAQGTYAHPTTYTGIGDVLRKTLIKEGYPGLFKGLVPTLAKVCPAVSISYLCYENLKKVMKLE